MTDRIRRVFIAVTPAAGDRVSLDADESHHVARVLRARPGDPLGAFDGRGAEWEARVASVDRDGVTVEVGARREDEVEPRVRIVLCQALVRPEKLEWILQKGTEVGITGFVLVPSERAESPAPSPSRMTRYRRVVLEACKQSGRRRVPTVTVGAPGALPGGSRGIALSPGSAPLREELAGPGAEDVWLGVGPEGGFSPDEVEGLKNGGWRTASLGPRVLRTETAGVVAAALILHAWADLG